MNTENKRIGARLKLLRIEAKMTQAEVANLMGCTTGFLSQLENGHSGISLSKLQQLLTVYGKTMADIADRQRGSDIVVSVTTANRLGFYGEDVDAALMVWSLEGKKMEPIVFNVDPGGTIGPMCHEGEEFCYILNGQFEVKLTNPETSEVMHYSMVSGEGIYYPSIWPHEFHNPTERLSSFLGIVTPPSF